DGLLLQRQPGGGDGGHARRLPRLRHQRGGAGPPEQHAAGGPQAGRRRMTAVDNSLLAGAATPAAGGAVAANGRGASDLFMTLLLAQIRNQDPLAPMESKDFVNQFASMTQVETMQTLASLTSTAAALQESMLVVNLGAQVGSELM